jgi:hypothetical protein
MKFIDLIKEPSDDKLLKKAKTIFSALRKGKITRSDGVSFSYELGGRTHARVYEGEIELIGSVISIKELTYCPINQRYMTELIEKKFEMFGINVELRPPNEDQIEKYQGKKPWEKDELNEEMDIDKERKRVKTIHKAIRKGIVNLSNGKYRYELPENYKFYLIDNEMINIKFTFHNNDLGQNFAGLGLPLRVWRIEDGKDVFLNGILSKDDVSDIVYGDDYLLNTKSGVDYTNVKNKIRNKYRDFNINAIMTSPTDNPMDLTPMVNESEEDYIKRTKTIFKAFKRGTIGPKDDPNEPRFKYELSEDIGITRNNVGIILFTDRIKITELNRACRHTSVGYMADKIRNRFRDFGIILEHPHINKEDVDTDLEREVELNEGAEVLNPESLTKNEIKKVKLIYDMLKTKVFKYDDQSYYGYTLPENYYIYKDELGDVCVKLDVKDSVDLHMFSRTMFRNGDHHDRELELHHHGLHKWVKKKIVEKFDGFNIKFIF